MQKLILTLVSGMALLLTACDDTPTADDTRTTTTETTQTAPAQEQQAPQQAQTTILALGDSLTEGLGVDKENAYPAQLQAYLHKHGYPNVEVINAGLSGETSNGLLNRIDWVLQRKPDVTILTIGANDAMRGLNVADTEANIRQAITTLREAGSDVILGGMQIYDNLGREYVDAYREIYPRIAEEMDVPLIPFFLNGVAADPSLNQQDGIHPTAEGYTIIVRDNIAPAVTQYLNQHRHD